MPDKDRTGDVSSVTGTRADPTGPCKHCGKQYDDHVMIWQLTKAIPLCKTAVFAKSEEADSDSVGYVGIR